MKTHHIHLHDEPFRAIASGDKTIESRLYDKKRQAYVVGDELLFENRERTTKPIFARITALHRYDTFAELFANASRHGFAHSDPEILRRNIMQYYHADEERRYGVLGIEFELVPIE